MRKIIYSLFFTIITVTLIGCKNDNQLPNVIIAEPTPTSTMEIEETYKSNEVIEISGTKLKMYDSYKANFYNAEIDFIDVDFIDYNLGVSLPKSVYDPNNLYYIEEDENGNVILRKNDANKIILNFMDDYHYTTFCYSTGVFSTWSYTIDKETYENLKYSGAYDVLTLLENESEIIYLNGYSFEKHYDNKEENAYRIIMEIDYYPFTEDSSSLFYHGYLVLLVRNTEVRAVCFAEPKFNDVAPYQMGYPVVDSCYWLDIPKIEYSENDDLEMEIRTTPSPTPTVETTPTPTMEPTPTEETSTNVSSTTSTLITPTPTIVENENFGTPIPTPTIETTPTPTQSLSSALLPNNKE